MGNRTSKNADDSVRIQIGAFNHNEARSKAVKRQQNRIISTKYTLLTFLPFNLFEQFRRLANFWFLLFAIISVSIDSPFSPLVSIIPLIFVISVTALKQGYEDFLRYRADNMVNKSSVTVIRNGEEVEILCENIIPGELVKITRDCDVPCDMILLKSSDDGKCFITTANLDGETNLKILTIPLGMSANVPVTNLYKIGFIECEQNTTDLYSFNGRLEVSNTMRDILTDLDSDSLNIPLTAENLMLRGSRVKNTEWAIACAVYTGQNTKLSLNSKITRNKMSSSEKFINKYLIFFMILLFGMTTVSYFIKTYLDSAFESHNVYIGEEPGPYNINSFIQNYFSFLILYYMLIPISLYITIEGHKLINSMYLQWDVHLYDENTNQPCIVNTSDLNEELGQINILFSDKTGTLTKNIMIFKQCSINGKMYNFEGRGLQQFGRNYSLKIGESPKHVYTFFEALALCHTVQVAGDYDENKDIADEELEQLNHSSEIPEIFNKTLEELNDMEMDEDDLGFSENQIENISGDESFYTQNIHLYRNKRLMSLTNEHKEMSHSAHRRSSMPLEMLPTSQPPTQFRERSASREFYAAPVFTSSQLVERNETMMERKQLETFIDILDYQASSPDEKALVEACARLGIVYLNDNNDIYTLRIRVKRKNEVNLNNEQNNIVQYKRLQVLEFTSDRKRMSVIVLDKSGQMWLYTKGAESAVLPLCTSRNSSIVSHTQHHIDEFAKQGLRTLAIARKKLTLTEYVVFKTELMEARTSITNRSEKVEECQKKIEVNLELLGATAVEDALQDDVRDTLESLRAAGIKIWVLTGDKVETALNIALSCGHISEYSAKYFITNCQNETELNEQLDILEGELQRNNNNLFALLIDGPSLAIALIHSGKRFRDLAYKCYAVLCCRLSPLQKSEVVRLVKTSADKPVTAAIGDGANDVSMLQEAHVSLGIIGKEGRQAARCADYAFVKFSMLKRMVLLHGHYFFHRFAFLILFFFYKNVVLVSSLMMFQFDSLFSTQSIYDSLFLTMYNIIYTTLPIILVTISEKIHPEETLLNKPSLYRTISRNKLFGWGHFVGWVILGLIHTLIMYFMSRAVWIENDTLFANGDTMDFLSFGLFLFNNIVVLTNFKLLITAVVKTYYFIGTVWLSIFGGFMLTTLVHNFFFADYDMNLYMIYPNLLFSASFWFFSTVVVVAGLLPDYTLIAFKAINGNFTKFYPGNRRNKPNIPQETQETQPQVTEL